MNDSRTVANYLLSLADQAQNSLTPMQLLKLVYIAHGWNLGLRHQPLICDRVEAWQYGPVIPHLYAVVRDFKSNPVASLIVQSDDSHLSDSSKDLLNQVYEIYGHLSGPALSRLTHQKNSPWDQTYVKGSFGLQISNDLIEDHYAKMSAQSGADT